MAKTDSGNDGKNNGEDVFSSVRFSPSCSICYGQFTPTTPMRLNSRVVGVN